MDCRPSDEAIKAAVAPFGAAGRRAAESSAGAVYLIETGEKPVQFSAIACNLSVI